MKRRSGGTGRPTSWPTSALGGRARAEPDPAERARKAVTQRIRNSLKRLAGVHPELAAHLDRSIRTGTFCTYQPERAIGWSL